MRTIMQPVPKELKNRKEHVFVIQSKRDMRIYGVFDTRDKALKYIEHKIERFHVHKLEIF